jgi:hypothetical protein
MMREYRFGDLASALDHAREWRLLTSKVEISCYPLSTDPDHPAVYVVKIAD